MSSSDIVLYDPTLENILSKESLKWIFVGGKGGVGKTTTSCAIAVELAKRRENVLILSTDPAHNLSDAFSQKFTHTPTLVNGFSNLYAMELDSDLNNHNSYSSMKLDSSFSKAINELVNSFPGIDEALSFAELMNSVKTMHYSVIVFDTAPTGHTLRLINFPELLQKGLNALANLRENMSGVLNVISTVGKGLINENDIHNKLDSMRALTASVRRSFENPNYTTFICVCIPEFLSVYETERLVQALVKANIDVSNIVVNQVLFPIDKDNEYEVSEDKFQKSVDILINGDNTDLANNILNIREKLILYEDNYNSRRKMQSKYLRQIIDLYQEYFHIGYYMNTYNYHIMYAVTVSLNNTEIRGLERIKLFSNQLLTNTDIHFIYDD